MQKQKGKWKTRMHAYTDVDADTDGHGDRTCAQKVCTCRAWGYEEAASDVDNVSLYCYI